MLYISQDDIQGGERVTQFGLWERGRRFAVALGGGGHPAQMRGALNIYVLLLHLAFRMYVRDQSRHVFQAASRPKKKQLCSGIIGISFFSVRE